MTKNEAKAKLGGTMRSLAAACGVSLSAIRKWPTELTRRQKDTVQAAILRKIEKVVK